MSESIVSKRKVAQPHSRRRQRRSEGLGNQRKCYNDKRPHTAGSEWYRDDCGEVGLNTLVKNQKRCKINPLEVKYEKPHVWVLKNPYRYKEPIPYIHPQGAVIWVNLSGFESQLPAQDFGFEPVENKFYYGQQLYVKKGSVKIGTGR